MGVRSRMAGAFMAAGIALAAPLTAFAQVAPTTSSPVRVWTLSGSTGLATVSEDRGVSVGAGVAWDFTPRWGLEIGGQWLDRPAAEQAWIVSATSQLRLRSDGRWVPYLRAGVAAFTTVLDSDAAEVPEFYRVRIQAARQSLFRPRHTFVDPAIVVGGGLDVRISRRVHVRPAVELVTAMDGGRTLVAPLASVQVAYHFETPRITPVRR